ncbi:MAG TPA: ABC transporter ATP-binding protein [Ktedonobacterales bacterium]|nr:ABC transporter ATP-binding protein [Ktedonobacterales bacterium]
MANAKDALMESSQEHTLRPEQPLDEPRAQGHDTRPLAIKTEDVQRIYKIRKQKNSKGEKEKTLVALSGVNLEVYQGELFGLLGPNGAGKTTLIKILTTLLAPSGGVCYVDGLDVVKQANEVRRRISMVSGGETSGYGILTVRENLWMFSQFYGVSWKDSNERIREMLKVVEMEDKSNARVSGLSTGQRQRMNFCRGFITDPRVVFLDEPTLGLDINAARIVRRFTREWMQQNPGRTVLLTTHYMAEADELCDRIAIIDHGTVLACDTPANLKRLLQKQPVFEVLVSGITEQAFEPLGRAPGIVRVIGEAQEDGSAYKLKFILQDEAAIGSVVSALGEQRGSIISLQKNEPTLEDVFVALVGRSLTAEDSNEG